ncbi:MAG: S-adenosyl-l-methionine hydroxide adenosyltransferase family protein [Candidatus Hermodarchaeota archaeon]
MADFNQKIICLLTDFGLKGQHYVASMKGVILKIDPKITIIDITHNITPFSIIEAFYVLKTTYKHFPEGSIFIIVVDPGVGSSREILALKIKSKHYFIGPNNGIFSGIFATEIEECVEIQNDDFFNKPISNTFHGRDIMAPVAAHLISGIPLNKFGPQFSLNLLKEIPVSYNIDFEDRVIQCVIQYIDSFGNITTNVPIVNNKIQNSEITLNEGKEIIVNTSKKKYKGNFTLNFSSVPVGSILFLIGSTGFLEISINQGNASKEMGFKIGDIIIIKL